jgi:hypothetical protein
MKLRTLLPFLCLLSAASAQTPIREPREMIPTPFDRYLERRVAEVAGADWQRDITKENWPAKQQEMRAQLQRMLGLDPWPERSPLQPTITGTVEGTSNRGPAST